MNTAGRLVYKTIGAVCIKQWEKVDECGRWREYGILE